MDGANVIETGGVELGIVMGTNAKSEIDSAGHGDCLGAQNGPVVAVAGDGANEAVSGTGNPHPVGSAPRKLSHWRNVAGAGAGPGIELNAIGGSDDRSSEGRIGVQSFSNHYPRLGARICILL